MKACPQCGYVRKEIDSIISEEECPKCGIIYSKWNNNPPGQTTQEAPPASEDTPQEPGVKKKMSVEKAVIFTILAVLAVVVLATNGVKMLRSGKSISGKESSVAAVEEQKNTLSENRSSGRDLSGQPMHNPAPQKELSIADIIRANRQSVVLVRTQTGIGSGFFINRAGSIVTNKHVLAQADRAEIKTINGSVFRISRIIHEDQDADLVIASTDAPPQESVPVHLNVRIPDVGEKIIVIGNPLGLEQTVSDGIVSAVRRNQQSVEFIQVTAPVSPGNSGGPLFNMYGEVIGVATFQYRGGQNLNFCVAASRVDGLQQGGSHSYGRDVRSPGARDVYCYADVNWKVNFVDWKTGMLLSNPDGSLDRVRYHNWVLEQIGGNPDDINPDKEAREDVERNREKLFKSVFPHRSMSDTNLTSAENDWLERRYQRHYVEVYNQAVMRRNEAIRKYRSMMADFERFAASRKP